MAYTTSDGQWVRDEAEMAGTSPFFMSPQEDEHETGGGGIAVNGVTYNTTGEAHNAIQAAGGPGVAQVTYNGQPANVSEHLGGYIINGQPINYLLGLGYAPGQEEEMARIGLSPAPPIPPTVPGGTNNIDDPNFNWFQSIYGLSPVPQIGQELLPEKLGSSMLL